MLASLPLQIQKLGGFDDQTLVLAHVASLREGSLSASPAAIRGVFLSLRLPPPAKVSNNLSVLKRQHLVMQPSPATWALTPLGLDRIRQLMANISDEALGTISGSSHAQPSLAETPHHLIPHELAPTHFHQGIGRFIEGHPFDQNVFGISRYPREDGDPVSMALATCRLACSREGYEFHLASDRTVEDFLFGNVAAYMWACRYGIAILEDRTGQGLNYNVVLEVGAMLVTGRRCLLLKDSSCPDLPTDLVGHIYSTIDLGDQASISQATEAWLKDVSTE